jgi:xanthine dehydrogenase YagS FAD-binding subunit
MRDEAGSLTSGDHMNQFEYQRADQLQPAIEALSRSSSAKFLAGGTNLVDLMKNSVETPALLIDINRLPLANIETLPDGGLRLGALARNSDTANHPLVRQHYPMLSQAILSGASPQLRNLATNGGNLMQRTRCPYFMDPGFPQCNKRAPGSGCGALEGINRTHAILGASAQCIATHPSDMCVALIALEARVRVHGPAGERAIPMDSFHRLPSDTPQIDTNLNPNELVVSIDLPPSPYASHSHYLKVRDRASYEFALVSVAAALELHDGQIKTARVALGGVAHKPWRSQSAEAVLIGHKPGGKIFQAAAQQAVKGATTYRYNQFKVELAQRAIVRALSVAGDIPWA